MTDSCSKVRFCFEWCRWTSCSRERMERAASSVDSFYFNSPSYSGDIVCRILSLGFKTALQNFRTELQTFFASAAIQCFTGETTHCSSYFGFQTHMFPAPTRGSMSFPTFWIFTQTISSTALLCLSLNGKTSRSRPRWKRLRCLFLL
jgi:hypothetical protein